MDVPFFVLFLFFTCHTYHLNFLRGRGMVCHYVRQGDTLFSLSKRYGIPTEKILNHPDNASLQDLRRDVGILRPGDRVMIPDPENKEIACATEARHRFRCHNLRYELRVQFLREDEPRGGEPYLLRLDMREVTGHLDDDGWLREMVPADAQEGVIILGEGSDLEEIPIQIGHLDPVNEVRGLQQRLKNLGFFSGEADDQPSEELDSAIRTFQTKYELEATGEMDQAAKERLTEIYGC